MNKIAILFTLALIGSTLTASTCTAAMKCIKCTGEACDTCYGGFVGTDECTALGTNCKEGTSATVCTVCNTGFALVTTSDDTAVPQDSCVAVQAANPAVASWTTSLAATVYTDVAVSCVGDFTGAACDTAPDPLIANCGGYSATDGTACTMCAAKFTLVGTTTCSAMEEALAGCLSTSAATTCDTACDGANSYWALAAGVCTSSTKIMAALATVALFFANF